VYSLENEVLRVELTEEGKMVSIRDKENNLLINVEDGCALYAQGICFENYKVRAVSVDGLKISFEVEFEGLPASGTINYILHEGGAVYEKWLEIKADEAFTLEGVDMEVVRVGNLANLRWVYGMRGCEREGELYPGFALQEHSLAGMREFAIGSPGRASEQDIPWFCLCGDGQALFGGIEWSGAWRVHFQTMPEGVKVRAGLDRFKTSLKAGESFLTPKMFVGVAPSYDIAALRTRSFARIIAQGWGEDWPWVLYNTWYGFGIGINEEIVKREAELAAEIGVEVFVIDAGWYEDSPFDPRQDFAIGLGNWKDNREKFPSGLGWMSQFVKGLGMRFGVWVEPERVDLRYIGKLIPQNWVRDEGPWMRLVCFAVPEVREWAKRTLSRLIEEFSLDWMKWDHNMWTGCSNEEHGHSKDDGGFFHILGVYEVMDYITGKYPHLALENCSGGGNRMDFGIIRRTRVGWIHDTTAPAEISRQHVYGAGQVMPLEYLNAWVIESEPFGGEEIDREEINYIMRSRMMNILGISLRLCECSKEALGAMRENIRFYKSIRDLLRGKLYHLTPQPRVLCMDLKAQRGWDAYEFVSDKGDKGVLLAFRAGGVEPVRVKLRGLEEDAEYRVEDVDGGKVVKATGKVLAQEGLVLDGEKDFTSCAYMLERV